MIMRLFAQNKREDSFISQLRMQAEKTLSCVHFLESNLDNLSTDSLQKQKVLMDELAEIKSELIDNLHNTFITPIDREDIYHISNSLSGITKYAFSTFEEMCMLDVRPDKFIREMIEKIKSETYELTQAINLLMSHPRLADEHLTNVTNLETTIDRTYREAIKVLFEDKSKLENELQNILHLREVYRHISNMSDKTQDAADALGMAVIKLS